MENRYTLKIYPERGSRQYYRVMTIGGSATLADLCHAILDAFEFDHDHLYQFYITERQHRGPTILGEGLEDFEGGQPPYATEVTLDSLGLEKGRKIFLHYDFGDDWIFVISVQKTEQGTDRAGAEVIKAKGQLEQYPMWDGT